MTRRTIFGYCSFGLFVAGLILALLDVWNGQGVSTPTTLAFACGVLMACACWAAELPSRQPSDDETN